MPNVPVPIDIAGLRDALGRAKPLLLLPLRLEYRVVSTRVAGAIRPVTRTEILFRWYPDDSFTESGIAPVAAHEAAALAAASAALEGRPWFDAEDPVATAAFEALAHQTGPARAVHLLRTAGQPGDPAWDTRIGTIAALPSAVALYAREGETVTALVTGRPIHPDLSYAGDVLDPSHWMFDIDEVVQRGMGVRLSDPDVVARALAADWIIAVGLHSGDAVAEVEALVADGVANGTFAFLRQDTPTNAAGLAGELDQMADLPAFHADAGEDERRVHSEAMEEASDLLGEALGVDPARLRPAPRSADTGREDARAMVRVVMPALLELVPDRATLLGPVDNDDLVDFFADWITARGQLPAVRVSANPYGVLPVTRLAALEALPDDDVVDEAIQGFLRGYGVFLREHLAAAARRLVPTITPGATDAGTTLEQALKVSPVSRRLDVGDRGSGDTAPVGCPYVYHLSHRPADYLRDLRTVPLARLSDPTADDRATPLLYRLARQSATRRMAGLGQVIVGAGDRVAVRLVEQSLGSLGALEILQSAIPDPSARLTRPSVARPGPAFTPVRDARVAAGSLASLSQSSISMMGSRATLAGFDDLLFQRFRSFTREFGSALSHLETVAARPDGVAQLEALLFETVDLVQHRVDAWAAGLAHRRLVKRRRSGVTGLAAGYYGMLGRLRPQSVTGATDGYLQAPSPEQATTSAVLRAAHLRFRSSGAFDIHLPSGRVRRALKLYDLVQKGLSLEEILGLAGERWLHDRKLDRLIAVLRSRFPIRDPADDRQVEIRLFDGRAFLAAPLSFAPTADRPRLADLQKVLGDDLDALADLVMCEAVHQRTLGNPAAANAWLQVLSGDPGPGEPVFARTRRHGHGSSHRLLLLVPAVEPAADASPREIAEPSLAALAAGAMSTFAAAAVTVVLQPGDPDLPGIEHRLLLGGDLGLTPFDLVVGGPDELRLRAVSTFLRWWQSDAGAQATLGPAPGSMRKLSAARVVEVDLDRGRVKPSRLLALATPLRRAVARGRWLQVGDLQSAAPAAEPLDEAVELERWASAATALLRRADLLLDRVEAGLRTLTFALDAAVVHARNLQSMVSRAAASAAIASEALALERAAAELREVLAGVSRLGEPDALVLAASAQLSEDPDGFEETGRALIDRLTAKVNMLKPLVAAGAGGAGRATVEGLRGALSDVLDGAALPVLAPFEQRGPTAPALSAAVPVADRLAGWSTAREGVERARQMAEAWALKAFTVTAAATDDESGDPTADQRPESVAPRSRFHGTVLSPSGRPGSMPTVAGVVLDEWSESRPSSQQTTGVALNYDAPQSEAPQCMLLCEPPSAAYATWTPAWAAEMVAEAIDWMTVRAMTTDMAAPGGPWLAGGNQVPWAGLAIRPVRRIPKQSVRSGLFPQGFSSASFVAALDVRHVTPLNEGIRRRGGGDA